MANMTFRMEGGRALDEALKQFAKPMAKTVARRALKKAADPILQAYRENTTKKTGALQKSEIAGTRLNPRQKRIAKKNPSKSALEVHIGTADPAGIQEEFGNINQAANPALRPAWDVHGGQVAVDRIGSVLEVEIKKQAERVARRAGRS